MSIGARIERGFTLAKQSFRVLMLDKELLVFPVLSTIAVVLVAASFIGPVVAGGYLEMLETGDEGPTNPLFYVWGFAFYFVNYFVIVFFNTAIVSAAMERLRGGDPTVGSGFASAVSLLPKIFTWALLSATVGFALRMIEERIDGIGRLVVGLVGVGWSIATYFVVPVLVAERLGPFAALKRSGAVMRKSWGEALVSNFGIGIAVFFASILCLIPGALGIMTGSGIAAAVGVGVTVVLLGLVAASSTALNAILVTALYEYASSGTVPEGFDRATLEGAFVSRR